jgi:acetylornithine/succinyldiaminopimelate/putrescine aminotransferase
MSRTGKWFGYQHRGATPDILTCAKALAGGVAMGVMIAQPVVASVLKPGMHASTFGGNPIACRASLATIETIEEEGLLERGFAIGERFRSHFQRLSDELGGLVREIRILGTMIGLDLTIDASEIVGRCMERRLLINATHGHVIRLLPALTVTDEQIDDGCSILADVLRRAVA